MAESSARALPHEIKAAPRRSDVSQEGYPSAFLRFPPRPPRPPREARFFGGSTRDGNPSRDRGTRPGSSPRRSGSHVGHGLAYRRHERTTLIPPRSPPGASGRLSNARESTDFEQDRPRGHAL